MDEKKSLFMMRNIEKTDKHLKPRCNSIVVKF